jgi:hypothetical protein
VKTKLSLYLVLFVFGVVVWGTADEMRNRPEWAQAIFLAFWTFVAYLFVDGLRPTADEIRSEQLRGKEEDSA